MGRPAETSLKCFPMSRPSAVDPELFDLLRRMRHPTVRSFEGRREPRHDCNRVAALIFEGLPAPIGCVIEDLSLSGCRLRLTAHVVLTPEDAVSVFIPCCRHMTTGRIVWQRGDEIGITLDAKPSAGRTRPESLTTDLLVATSGGPASHCRGVSPGSGGRASCAASSRAGWCRTR